MECFSIVVLLSGCPALQRGNESISDVELGGDELAELNIDLPRQLCLNPNSRFIRLCGFNCSERTSRGMTSSANAFSISSVRLRAVTSSV